jgi:hypothetical protein
VEKAAALTNPRPARSQMPATLTVAQRKHDVPLRSSAASRRAEGQARCLTVVGTKNLDTLPAVTIDTATNPGDVQVHLLAGRGTKYMMGKQEPIEVHTDQVALRALPKTPTPWRSPILA